MEGSTLLSTLGWTGCSDEITQLLFLLRSKLLLQQVGITVILPLCIADVANLCEWVKGWLLLFWSRLTFRASVALMTAAQRATTAGAEVRNNMEHSHTTPNTQQVREQATAHALVWGTLGRTQH